MPQLHLGVGGAAELSKKHGATLWFTVEAIGIGLGKPKHAVIPMSRVKSVEVTAEAPQVRGGGSFLLGGGVVSSREHVSIGVHLDSGEVAYFTAEWLGVAKAKAALSSVLRAAGIRFHDEAGSDSDGGRAGGEPNKKLVSGKLTAWRVRAAAVADTLDGRAHWLTGVSQDVIDRIAKVRPSPKAKTADRRTPSGLSFSSSQ